MPHRLSNVAKLLVPILLLSAVMACEPMPVPTGVAPTRTPTPIPPTATATPTLTPTPKPTPTLPPMKRPGVLVIGAGPMTAKHFNPIWLNSAPQFLAFPLILPALTWFDDKAQPIMDLATKVDVNADATAFTVTLPKNAVWSDGAPLTAKDVAYTYKLALDPAIASTLWGINLASIKGAAEYQKGTLKDVEGIKVVNDQTIRFDLKESNGTFLFNTYLGILPSQILSKFDPKDIEKQAFVDTPTVTSGPYDLVKYEPGQYIQLRKKSNYWGKTVNVGEIFVRLFDQPTDMLAALEAGDLNVAAIPVEQAARFRSKTSLDVLSIKGIAYTALHIDARTKDQLANLSKPKELGGSGYSIFKIAKPYLADKRFRQALDYAIDDKAIVQNVMGGEATPIYSAIFGPDWAINPNLAKYDYNLDKAKALMKDAGITFDVSSNALFDGKPVALTFLANTSDESRRLGEALQQQLAKVGIRVETRLAASSDFLQAAINGDGDLIRNVGNRLGADPSVSGMFYTCKAGWAELVMGYCNPRFDDLQGKGFAFYKTDDRKKTYQDASAILNDELPSLFLYAPNSLIGVKKGLTGVKPNADPNVITWNIQDWNLK